MLAGDCRVPLFALTGADALRRYELKEVHPAAARARALLEELAPTAAEETLV